MTFLLSRRFLDRRLALVAAVFTMAFPTFFTDMPYLVRQEMALRAPAKQSTWRGHLR